MYLVLNRSAGIQNPTEVLRIFVWCLGTVSLVAAVGFCMYSGKAFRRILALEAPNAFLKPESDEASARPVPSFSAYQIILNKNLFGAVASEPTKATPNQAPPATSLKLRLVGTNVGGGSSPFAIIEDEKKAQEVFDLNEMVFGQAKLVEVLPELVRLERGGKIEVLELEDIAPSSSGSEESSVTSSGGTEFSVSEQEVTDALANLPQLLSQARAVPYFRNGKSVGMRLFAIRRGSLYEKLGLQNGDIIKAVNSTPLTDPAQALKLFEQLKTERNIGVQLERAGQDTQLSYSIR